MVVMRSTAVLGVLFAVMVASLAGCGCYQKGSKLIRKEKELRTSLQDVNSIMAGNVSLTPERPLEITRDTVTLWVTMAQPAQTGSEVQFIGDRICQFVLDTLSGMDINAGQDKVTVTIHILEPPLGTTGLGPEVGTSLFDGQTGEMSFRQVAPET